MRRRAAPALARLRAFAQRWRARLSTRRAGVALLYHAIADVDGDAATEILPALSSAGLEAHVRHLMRHYRLVPPSALPREVECRRRGGRIPVALTFDDDLSSHLTHAAPLLRRMRAPAAFFLCGASLEHPRRFWWESLQVAIDSGALAQRHLADLDAKLVDAALERKARAAKELARSIEEMSRDAREALSAELERLVGAPPDDAGLRSPQARQLLSDGFEVGFHTLRHDRLPPLADGELRAAMSDGREQLAAALGADVATISYPHGRADGRVAAAARSAGFIVGFAAAADAGAGADALLCPRIDVSRLRGSVFALAVASAAVATRRPRPRR